MESDVYFARVDMLPDIIPPLLERIGFMDEIEKGEYVGVKTHFGEEGNRNYLSPKYIREVIRVIRDKGGKPLLLETTTLYRGERQNASSHIRLAKRHGFGDLGAEIVIVDGEHGDEYEEVETTLPLVKRAKIAKGLKEISLLLNLSHFKGHMLTGFGGAIKNIGMGLAAKGGKLEMHSLSKPRVIESECTGCGECVKYCPYNAIRMNKVAEITENCIGCCGCLSVCESHAIRIEWEEESAPVSKRMAEYAYAISLNRKIFNINFLINITPNCDCYPSTEKPFLPDIGLFAGRDPVACDTVSLLKIEPQLRKIHPEIDPWIQILHSERIGLGKKSEKVINL